MKIIFGLLFLLVLPSVLAMDCSKITNRAWCEEIQNSAITEEEKAYLLSDIISEKKNYPDHALVRDWNKQIDLTQAPAGVTLKNSGVIRNAWLKVLAVMPSVLYEGELFVAPRGEVLTAYAHEVKIPTGKDSGDCKTLRYLIKNEGLLNVYADGNLQGRGHQVNYQASRSLKAAYNIHVQTKIKHYRQKKYCDEENCWYVCEYSHTEYKNDDLTLTEEWPIKVENLELEAKFRIKDKYPGGIRGELVAGDFVNLELNFYDAYFQQHNFVFSEIFLPPNILTVKAERQPSTEQRNLAYTNGEMVLANTNGCQIKLYDFFQEKIIPCDLNFERVDFSVQTDKNVYKENETIKVQIEPAGNYEVNYAEQNYTSSGNLQLKAVYPYNRLTIKAGEKVTYEYIHVQNDEPLTTAFSLAIFGTMNYALIALIKKYWGMVL